MCREERLTTKRGRSGVPETFLRRRKWRRACDRRRLVETSVPRGVRFTTFALSAVCWLISLTRLSDLAADNFALVADALALVRVRAPQATDVGSDLTDRLLVDAADGESRGRLDRERDAFGRLDQHRVAVAERELEVLDP